MIFYLVSWLFETGLSPVCVCETVDAARRSVADRLDAEPIWTSDERMCWTMLNILYDGHVLQGVLIQQIPLHKEAP